MAVIRWVLGRLILLFDFIFSPRRFKRAPELQTALDNQTQNMALYQFAACPFCVKVRRAMKRHNINVTLRDAKNDAAHRDALLQGGGKVKVPCLRIDENGQTRWLYESNDIIAYLQGLTPEQKGN